MIECVTDYVNYDCGFTKQLIKLKKI